jgi:competence protein ComEC
MLSGGIWLALWRTRVRLLGASLIVLGFIATPWMARPDVLIGKKGTLVAVRDASGKLSSMPAHGSKYDLQRWLEYDGDGRTARDAQGGNVFSCDAVGCIARVKGATVAVARHPAAVADDCLNADILILDEPKPSDCAVPSTVIDVFDRWRNGAYAIYLDRDDNSPEPHVRLETVAEHRGVRPWSPAPHRTAHRARGGGKSGKADGLPKPRIGAPGAAAAKTNGTGTPPSGTASAADKPPETHAALDVDPGEIADPEEENDRQ